MASPAPRTHARHVVALHDGHELDVLRIGGRLNLFEQGGKRIAHPGNDHGPAFDTAQPVDPLFHGRELEQFFDIEGTRLADLAFDAHRPGARLQLTRMGRRVALVQAEFIVVVVGRDIRQRRLLVHDAQGTCLPGQHGRLAHGRIRGPGAARPPRQAQARRGDARPQDQIAPGAPDPLRRDLGRLDGVGLAYQHHDLRSRRPRKTRGAIHGRLCAP